MDIFSYTLGPFDTNTYLINTESTLYLIDAPLGVEKLESIIKSFNKELIVLLTHGHLDHTSGLDSLLSFFRESKVYLKKEDWEMARDGNKDFEYIYPPIMRKKITSSLLDYDNSLPFKIIPTPGHTPGSVSIFLENEKILFSGDTIFSHSYGRTDLGGDEKELFLSIKKLLTLPESTTIYPGHGEGTTIEREKNFYE